MFTVKRSFSTFLALVVVASAAFPSLSTAESIQCGSNETLSLAGYDCLSCLDLSNSCSLELRTTPKCFCLPGYVRNSGGNCVLLESCNYSCGPNEALASTGYDCATCKNYRTLNSCQPRREKKCYCLSGYVYNDNNECVRPEDC